VEAIFGFTVAARHGGLEAVRLVTPCAPHI
jgi:hypothetical protein